MNQKTRWMYPQAIENQINRSLLVAVSDLIEQMKLSAKRLKIDTAQEIEEEDSDLSDVISALLSGFVSTLPALALAIYRYNSAQFLKVANNSGGKNNPVVLALGLYGINADEPWWLDTRNSWIVGTQLSASKLLNNIKDDFINNAITAQAGNTVDLNDRYRIYRKRTANIAAGITGSLNSNLMRRRLEDAGVSQYVWRGILDDRERPSHVLREGVSFKSDGSDAGKLDGLAIFPGQPYGCRCWAVPKWENLINEE